MPDYDRKHNCPDCTHERCKLCKGYGFVIESQSHTDSGGRIYGMSSTSKECPNGCPPPMLMN